MGDKRLLRVTVQQEGTVGEYLKNTLRLTTRQIARLKFKEDGIVVGGRRVTVRERLFPGDELVLAISDADDAADVRPDALQPRRNEALWLPPAPGLPALTVLYRDADLLAVDKPSGLPMHPGPGHYRDTLANQAAEYLGIRLCRELHIIGRLDRDTAGIVLFAANAAVASLLARQRESGELRKVYLALAEGEMKDGSGVIDAPLARVSPEENRMHVSPEGKAARTHYQVLQVADGRTLLKLWLEQGRTHQIRAHMASIGHPLVGDVLYGQAAQIPLALKAVQLSLKQPFTGEELLIHAPLPAFAEEVPAAHVS